MAVASEGSPDAVCYVYIVGGEDFVAREIKRRLLKLGVNVSGHASFRWKNADFTVPALTTHILVVSDEVRADLRGRALEQGKKWNIPVIEAPARNEWSTAEELLRKHGLLEPYAPPLARLPPPAAPAVAAAASGAPAPAAPTTLGEALAAKGESLTPTPTKDEPMSKSKSSGTPEQRALIKKLFEESEGKVGNAPITEIVQRQVKGGCSIDTVRALRKEFKVPPARPGPPGQEQIAFFKKYGIEYGPVPRGGKAERVAAKPPPPSPARPAPAQPGPVRRRPRPDAELEATDEVIEEAIREAISFLDTALIQRFHLTDLALRVDEGVWQDPEFGRVKITRGKVKLK